MCTQRVDNEHDILGFTVHWIRELADQVDEYLPGPRRHLAYQLSRYVARVNWSGSKIEEHTGWAPEMSIESTYEDLANA